MILERFMLHGRTAVVTGGEGLIGTMICRTIEELQGEAISVDVQQSADFRLDITNITSVENFAKSIKSIDILINCAVGNQHPVSNSYVGWDTDLAIGLTGAVNMIHAFESKLLLSHGVVLNIGSDLSLIAPDQFLYENGVKPLSYSVVKHGLVGLTRYFASTWGNKGRCNCICPGGIDKGQKFPRIPLGRLAGLDELAGPVAFLISDASSYMTGSILTVDGGRTAI